MAPEGHMPTSPKKSVTQINVELDPALLDRLKTFADERGQTLKYVVGRALTRHLDHPPPMLPDPALPETTPDPPASTGKKSAAKRGRKT